MRTIGSRLRLAVAGPHGWGPTTTFADGGELEFQTTPETGIADDRHPAAGDLTIAAGASSALLAWTTLARQPNGNRLHRVRLASYRPYPRSTIALARHIDRHASRSHVRRHTSHVVRFTRRRSS